MDCDPLTTDGVPSGREILRFEKGEKVLCYEPDPKKAKVLYDSKILATYETVSKDGAKDTLYKVHFQGWSSTWDRKVYAGEVLKDTEENRQLQKDLAAKAQLQLGSYLYRRETSGSPSSSSSRRKARRRMRKALVPRCPLDPGADVDGCVGDSVAETPEAGEGATVAAGEAGKGEEAEGERESDGSDGSGDESYSSDSSSGSGSSTGSSSGSERRGSGSQSGSGSESEGSDSDASDGGSQGSTRSRMQRLSCNSFEWDEDPCCSKDAKERAMAGKDERGGAAKCSCEPKDTFQAEKRVLLRVSERLRQYLEYDYDVIVKHGKQHALPARMPVLSILENFVKQSTVKLVFTTAQPVDVSRRRTTQLRQDKKEQEFERLVTYVHVLKEVADSFRIFFDFTIKEYLLYREEKAHAFYYLSEEFLRTFKYTASPDCYNLQITGGSGSQQSTSHGGSEPPTAAGTSTAGASDWDPRPSASRSHRPEEGDAQLENCMSSIASTSSDSSAPLQYNVSACSINYLISLQPLALNIPDQTKEFLQEVLQWRLLPPETPASASMIFGAPHLARLIVTLPEFLNAALVSDTKMKLLTEYLDSFTNYLESRREWFTEENYTSLSRGTTPTMQAHAYQTDSDSESEEVENSSDSDEGEGAGEGAGEKDTKAPSELAEPAKPIAVPEEAEEAEKPQYTLEDLPEDDAPIIKTKATIEVEVEMKSGAPPDVIEIPDGEDDPETVKRHEEAQKKAHFVYIVGKLEKSIWDLNRLNQIKLCAYISTVGELKRKRASNEESNEQLRHKMNVLTRQILAINSMWLKQRQRLYKMLNIDFDYRRECVANKQWVQRQGKEKVQEHITNKLKDLFKDIDFKKHGIYMSLIPKEDPNAPSPKREVEGSSESGSDSGSESGSETGSDGSETEEEDGTKAPIKVKEEVLEEPVTEEALIAEPAEQALEVEPAMEAPKVPLAVPTEVTAGAPSTVFKKILLTAPAKTPVTAAPEAPSAVPVQLPVAVPANAPSIITAEVPSPVEVQPSVVSEKDALVVPLEPLVPVPPITAQTEAVKAQLAVPARDTMAVPVKLPLPVLAELPATAPPKLPPTATATVASTVLAKAPVVIAAQAPPTVPAKDPLAAPAKALSPLPVNLPLTVAANAPPTAPPTVFVNIPLTATAPVETTEPEKPPPMVEAKAPLAPTKVVPSEPWKIHLPTPPKKAPTSVPAMKPEAAESSVQIVEPPAPSVVESKLSPKQTQAEESLAPVEEQPPLAPEAPVEDQSKIAPIAEDAASKEEEIQANPKDTVREELKPQSAKKVEPETPEVSKSKKPLSPPTPPDLDDEPRLQLLIKPRRQYFNKRKQKQPQQFKQTEPQTATIVFDQNFLQQEFIAQERFLLLEEARLPEVNQQKLELPMEERNYGECEAKQPIETPLKEGEGVVGPKTPSPQPEEPKKAEQPPPQLKQEPQSPTEPKAEPQEPPEVLEPPSREAPQVRVYLKRKRSDVQREEPGNQDNQQQQLTKKPLTPPREQPSAEELKDEQDREPQYLHFKKQQRKHFEDQLQQEQQQIVQHFFQVDTTQTQQQQQPQQQSQSPEPQRPPPLWQNQTPKRNEPKYLHFKKQQKKHFEEEQQQRQQQREQQQQQQQLLLSSPEVMEPQRAHFYLESPEAKDPYQTPYQHFKKQQRKHFEDEQQLLEQQQQQQQQQQYQPQLQQQHEDEPFQATGAPNFYVATPYNELHSYPYAPQACLQLFTNQPLKKRPKVNLLPPTFPYQTQQQHLDRLREQQEQLLLLYPNPSVPVDTIEPCPFTPTTTTATTASGVEEEGEEEKEPQDH